VVLKTYWGLKGGGETKIKPTAYISHENRSEPNSNLDQAPEEEGRQPRNKKDISKPGAEKNLRRLPGEGGGHDGWKAGTLWRGESSI